MVVVVVVVVVVVIVLVVVVLIVSPSSGGASTQHGHALSDSQRTMLSAIYNPNMTYLECTR